MDRAIDYANTVLVAAIAALLAYLAYRTGWHAALFGFVTLIVCGVGDRVVGELRRSNALREFIPENGG